MAIADIRLKARRALHNHLARPASYYDASGTLLGLVHIRVHQKPPSPVGDLAGTNLSFSQTQEISVRVLFDRAEVAAPLRNELVILDAEEGYYLDNVLPPDGITVKAEVVRMSVEDITGKTLPNGSMATLVSGITYWGVEEW